MKRLRNNKSILSALLVAACAAAASASTFTWTGSGSDDNWTTEDNWSVNGFASCVYPCTTSDDALIPVVSGVWGDVDLDFTGTITIDDMTILDGVDFLNAETVPITLVLDKFTMDADDAAITVTFRGRMTVTTESP